MNSLADIQRRIGVTPDGLWGPKTAAAILARLDLIPPPSAEINPKLFRVLAQHLEDEEGRVAHAYQDHLGYWTIGIGRLIDKRKGGRLSDAEIDMLLASDIRAKHAEIRDWPAWQAVKDDPVRATALLSMAFQIGADGLAKFTASLPLIAAKRWAAAAANLRQSLWAKQTPDRAARVIHMIETGALP